MRASVSQLLAASEGSAPEDEDTPEDTPADAEPREKEPSAEPVKEKEPEPKPPADLEENPDALSLLTADQESELLQEILKEPSNADYS
jgi:hypothetical protein